MGLLDSLKKSLANGVTNSINRTVSGAKSSVNSGINKAVNNAAKDIRDGVSKAVNTKTKKVKFDTLPATFEEFKALPEAKLTDYFESAALAVVMLQLCATNREEGLKALEFLNGPDAVSGQDRQFINDQFMDNRSYIPRSYFKGSNPENNYTPDQPYVVEIIENAYSKEEFEKGYLTLYCESSGADSERVIKLRNKKSTGEWFVTDFRGLLSGIRIPKEQDAWA